MRKRRIPSWKRSKTNTYFKHAPKMGLLILLCALFLIYAFWAYAKTGTIVPTAELIDGRPTMYFIDVGQGDCTLITYRSDAVLVDAGPRRSGDEAADYLRLYAPNIDYMIITHPHEDHMGGAAEILERINVENLVINDIDVPEQFFGNAINAAERAGTNIIRLTDGAEFDTPSGAIHINILDTFEFDYDDYNNASLITRVTVGSTVLMITGDAEREKEAYLTFTYTPEELDCDILQVGHHGSNTSSSEKFLEAASPEYAVISCGENNSYGHPSPQALDRLKDAGATVFRTDKKGTIILRGDK